MGQREQRKARTRAALADAAVRLFTERGYDEVTMAEVAVQAQVSRRTAFRYFASKDDLVLEHPAQWLVIFDAALEAHRDRALGERIATAAEAVVAHIEADPTPVRQLYRLAFAHPSIAGRFALSSTLWIDRLADEIDRDLADGTRSRMIAAATMGIINTVGEVWAATDQPMGPLLESGLRLLAHPLAPPDPATQVP